MRNSFEKHRNLIQDKLDKEKTQLERNQLGQFSTPTNLANDILKQAKAYLDKELPVSFLDPAIGTGSFFSALLKTFPSSRIERALGFEIDPHYGNPSRQLWRNTLLQYNIGDFTKQRAPESDDRKYSLLICNPPYVRHHHLNGKKDILSQATSNSSNIKLSGLAGLYCYFIGISHKWMKSNGLAGWLVPSEFMDVNYGNAVKNYLLNDVTLLQVHRFDPKDLQFSDALVSSAVVWLKNTKPNEKHEVVFSYGGTLEQPKIVRKISSKTLSIERKWTRFPILEERTNQTQFNLGDFFIVKRGIATGNNKFFILDKSQIQSRKLPFSQFRPILPSPKKLLDTTIEVGENGNPILTRELFVLDSSLPLNEIQANFPELYSYIQEGIQGDVIDSYLCKSRKIWYKQEERKPAPFYCTYVGRTNQAKKNPFKFILNKSTAIATNSYLCLYPRDHIALLIKSKPQLLVKIKQFLDSITMDEMLEEGRVYGGGMYKVEPKELTKVAADDLKSILTTKRPVTQGFGVK